MGTRVPVQHYHHLRPASSFIETSIHDLNTVDARSGEIEAISDVDRDAVTEDSLENDDESNSVDCMHESYRNALPLHGSGVDEECSPLENSGRSSTPPYNILSLDGNTYWLFINSYCKFILIAIKLDASVGFCNCINKLFYMAGSISIALADVLPIETARARFLQIIVDHFISEHVIEREDSADISYGHGNDKLNKRKPREAQYEGDQRFVLPLMYVANLYETLVSDVNMRISSLDGIREKTIGVALEAAGGLYRRLAKKFPRKGPCSFKRRELATSLETRTRFPELVVHEEKRVRFVVVNGLAIVEKPSSMAMEDTEWFKRVTGRLEVAICARDYKFYSPRHKYRRVTSQSPTNIPGLTAFSGSDTSPLTSPTGFRPVNEPQNQQQSPSKLHIQQLAQQPQFHTVQQPHHQCLQQSQHATHFPQIHQCPHPSHLSDISQQHQSPTIPQHMTCLQPLSGGHIGGRLHLLLTTPAKFCDECGAPYLRETSKFCSECGTRRLGT